MFEIRNSFVVYEFYELHYYVMYALRKKGKIIYGES